MKLFSFWRSLATYRVRIALNLKGLKPEVVTIDLMKGDQRQPAFKAVNPQMVIPALVDGDGPVLFESLAIIEYLDETHPDPPLLPKDTRGRARVRGLAQIVACDSNPLIVPRVRDYLEHGNLQNAVNFPDAAMAREAPFSLAIANANVPDMLGRISHTLGKRKINIHNMLNKSRKDMAYTLVDVDSAVPAQVTGKIADKAIHSGRCGKDWMTSMPRWIRMSVQPP